MSDKDMIRRGDAHRTIVLTGEHVAGMKSSAVIDHVCAAIRALPAVSAQAQIDVAGWQPIETAPHDCVIDLWSIDGGRYPDAIWDTCCGEEGWTDANDHHSLEGASFTHWRHRPAPPAIRKGDQP